MESDSLCFCVAESPCGAENWVFVTACPGSGSYDSLIPVILSFVAMSRPAASAPAATAGNSLWM